MCDKQHRCYICRKYLHLLCGYEYFDNAGNVVENLSFPKICNNCHTASQRSASLSKENELEKASPPKDQRRSSRKRLLPLQQDEKAQKQSSSSKKRRSSSRKKNLQNDGTPQAEVEELDRNEGNAPNTTKTISQFDSMVNQFDNMVIREKELELNDADGGNSDEEGNEFEILQESYIRSLIERSEEENDVIHIEDIASDNIAFVAAKKGILDPTDTDQYQNRIDELKEMPENYEVPAKKDIEEPDFNAIDNPGNWNQFIFRPIYDKSGRGATAKYKYVHHELPTGCTPVPMNENGKREVGGWEFHYGGWHSNRFQNNRSGANPANLFPKERESTLDIDLFCRLGLTEDRMESKVTGLPDALFFLQLLLPICDPSKSGIEKDPRQGFYPDVVKFSNYYKYRNGIGSIYGHKVKEAEVMEYVRFDGCLVRDGVLGGGHGGIYKRWAPSFSAGSDENMKKSLNFSRWYELKRMMKFNDNTASVPKQGEAGYNPCVKYDLIYEVLVNNTIALTRKGELDLTGDETSWPHQGFGEKGAKNLWRIPNKPGVSKGGQTLLVSATNRIRPYFYQHRHRFTQKYGKPLFDSEGPAEVRTCLNALENMIEGRGDEEKKKIFVSPPHLTFDNYFSGEEVFHYAGKKGFGLTMTTRRDRLPKSIPSKYVHKKKTTSDARSKAARYVNPVIAVKNEEDYEIVLTSFQSTSSTNIMSVNALSQSANFVEARSRGRNDKKRIYFIEQNFARQLYLKTYSRIDSIDHFLNCCSMGYTSWKYWHAPANHGKKLAVVTAYDMYLEIAEGTLHPKFKIPEPVSFHTFLDALSLQMLSYDPKNQRYPGDSSMRVVTQLTQEKRNKHAKSGVSKSNGSNHVTFDQFKQVAKNKKKGRFCNMSTYVDHVQSITTHKYAARCAVCGLSAYKKCGICGVSLHNNDSKGHAKGRQCFLHFHDENHFGLCFADRSLTGLNSNTWREPSKAKRMYNARVIANYRTTMG